MRIECRNCGGAHPTWDCKRPAKQNQSQPDETLRRIEAGLVVEAGTKSTAPKGEGIVPRRSAKSTSLPVDTNAGSSNGRTAPFEGVNAGSTPAPASILKPGRPSTGFDKAAYNRGYMRQYRARKKASAEGRG